jgi:hypothetical protein
MAADDGLKQIYGIPGVTATRQGYVFAKQRRQDKREGKRKDQSQEAGKQDEETGEEKKGVDIKV